ncbi:MAG: YeeE/YedE family protein [Myxococcales bacterium]|nr:YeeE/YedE family protein [Myxococcales bacterium]
MNALSLATSAAGGVLIGLASVGYLLLVGRIAGVSGVLGGLAIAEPDDRRVRAGFLAGLVAGAVALRLVFPRALGTPTGPLGMLIVAGLLVGVGTTLANGCTSGHGVCGLGRRSARSLVAVLVFMAVAMVTASLRGGAS